jgi:hypothetical protein
MASIQIHASADEEAAPAVAAAAHSSGTTPRWQVVTVSFVAIWNQLPER